MLCCQGGADKCLIIVIFVLGCFSSVVVVKVVDTGGDAAILGTGQAVDRITLEGDKMIKLYDNGDVAVFLQESESKNAKTGNTANLWVRGRTVAHMCPADCVRRPDPDMLVQLAKGKSGVKVCYAWRGKAGLHVGKVTQSATRIELRRAVGGRKVRSAVIGDTGMIPADVWADLQISLARAGASAFLGYTHNWRNAPWLRDSHMASCDSQAEHLEAQSLGWRTFTVEPANTAIWRGKRDGQAVCPAVVSNGRVTCDTCGMCDGLAGAGKPDIVVPAHGAGAKN